MCTSATYKTNDFYFGRTLDYEFSYGEVVAITPRNYPINFHFMGEVKNHYAMIGMAGLNFVGNAKYYDVDKDKENVAQYEFINYILSQCANVTEVKKKLKNINITATQFNENYPLAQLHYIVADKESCIVVETMEDGMHIYDNKVGVLTNNPPYPQQMFMLNNYMGLSPKQPENTFSQNEKLDFTQYSRGMGALGLPGDLSSASRFARVAFVKMNSKSSPEENSSVSQFFHILNSVDQQRGCCEVTEGKYEITIYTSCCNCDKGIYYYTTYDNHQITAIDMHKENLDSDTLISYPIIINENIKYQN